MGTDDYMASIGVTASTYAPQNYSLCSGDVLSIAQNTALFSLIGSLYGGNVSTSFGLPDLRGATPIGSGQSPTSALTLEPGETLGTLTEITWPGGYPAAATSGEATTLPDETGAYGVALNWAICLYGEFPDR